MSIEQAGLTEREWLSARVQNPNWVPGSQVDTEMYQWTPLYHDQAAYVNGTAPVVNNPYNGSVDLSKMELALAQWTNVISYSGTKTISVAYTNTGSPSGVTFIGKGEKLSQYVILLNNSFADF